MFPWPYLDLAGFTLRTVMPATDVATLARIVRPGYIESAIARAQSYLEARARKNYRKSLPFGGSPPPLAIPVTLPPAPAPALSGVPTIGSMRLVLAITTPGNDGAAFFKWSLDNGVTFVGSVSGAAVTFGGAGYTTAPSVVIDPPAQGGTQATATATIDGNGIVNGIAITNAGAGYVTTPILSFVGGGGAGATAIATGITAIPVAIPTYNAAAPTAVFLSPTGLSVTWPAGAYLGSYLYQGTTPVPEIVLQWLTQIVTADAYKARGRNPGDPSIEDIEKDRAQALAEILEFANGDTGLLDVPIDDSLGSAVTTGPLGHAEASPYVAFDEEARRGRHEDARSYARNGWDE